MKFSDLEEQTKRGPTKLVARITDTTGKEEFELTIAGPRALTKRMFADAEIDLTIDPARTSDDVLAEYRSAAQQQRQEMWEVAGLSDPAALLKPASQPPEKKDSVFAAVRPVRGEGTPFAFAISGFFVPTGVSFFFFGSFVFTTVGSLVPATGDQDLFLRLFSPTGTVVSSSIAGGTSVDVVWFTFPLLPYVPVFEVKGFTAGVCRAFTAHGA